MNNKLKCLYNNKMYELNISTYACWFTVKLYINQDVVINESINFTKTFNLRINKPSVLLKTLTKMLIENECIFHSDKLNQPEQQITNFLLEINKHLPKEILDVLDKEFIIKFKRELSSLEKEYENLDKAIEERIEKEINKIKKIYEKHKIYIPKRISKLKKKIDFIIKSNE